MLVIPSQHLDFECREERVSSLHEQTSSCEFLSLVAIGCLAGLFTVSIGLNSHLSVSYL
jgi:hypothetical protein